MRLSAAQARALGLTVPKSARRTPRGDPLRDTLLAQLDHAGLPTPRVEILAGEIGISERRWRYDLGWRGLNLTRFDGRDVVRWLLVEIQGGLWVRGAHARAGGIERDIEKLNAAQLAGHVCLQVSASHVQSGLALLWIEKAMRLRA